MAAPLLAGAFLAGSAWMAGGGTLSALEPGVFDDTDGDFLPDDLEWLLMSNSTTSDSDQDGIEDYVEAVTNGFPRVYDDVAPAVDHEIRVLATTRTDGDGVSWFWLHFLFRSASGLDVKFKEFVPWIDLGGERYPIDGLLASVPLQSVTSDRGSAGTFVVISAPVATEEVVRQLLPFSLGVSAVMGGRAITSSSFYLDSGGETVALIAPYPDRAGLQTLQQGKQEGPFPGSNKLCVVQLDIVGTSAGSKICEVRSADCEDAHGLRCGTSCRQVLGKIFVLPDGMSTITGG